jgi:hypothetical protein
MRSLDTPVAVQGELERQDIIYKLPHRAMKNKLRQFGIESEDLASGS